MIRICDTPHLDWYDKPQILGKCGFIHDSTRKFFNLRNIITRGIFISVKKFIENYPSEKMLVIEMAVGQSDLPVFNTSMSVDNPLGVSEKFVYKSHALDLIVQLNLGSSQFGRNLDKFRNELDIPYSTNIKKLFDLRRSLSPNLFNSGIDYSSYGISPQIGRALDKFFLVAPDRLIKIITREGNIKIDTEATVEEGYYPIAISFNPLFKSTPQSNFCLGDEILFYRPKDIVKEDIQKLADHVYSGVVARIKR